MRNSPPDLEQLRHYLGSRLSRSTITTTWQTRNQWSRPSFWTRRRCWSKILSQKIAMKKGTTIPTVRLTIWAARSAWPRHGEVRDRATIRYLSRICGSVLKTLLNRSATRCSTMLCCLTAQSSFSHRARPWSDRASSSSQSSLYERSPLNSSTSRLLIRLITFCIRSWKIPSRRSSRA